MIDKDADEIFIVFRWSDVIAVVDSEQMAEELCIGPDNMGWERFVLPVEDDPEAIIEDDEPQVGRDYA